MKKRLKDFLEESGLDSETYKECVGISTRNKPSVKKDQISQKVEEKKKPQSKKESYIPPLLIEPVKPTVIQFGQFKQYVEELKKFIKDDPQQYMEIQILYAIHRQTIAKGGIVEISSINGFSPIVKTLILPFQQKIYHEINSEFIQKVRQLLFSIQFISRNKAEVKIYELGLVNFVSKQELRQHIRDKIWGLKYFNYDLTLFQEGAEGIDVDKSIFNLDYMCTHYSKQKIDIRIQNPLDYGFKPSKLKNKKYQMTLGQYRFYQINFLDDSKMRTFKHAEQLGRGQVFFGVNFEPSDQVLNRQIKRNVEGTFLDFHGDFDMMSYLDSDVPGCSLPQMYFKTPGCWTGGHQQNICMSALNINHGPDYSQWFTLELKYIQKLRDELLQTYNTDLYLSQGLWYERLEWFISRGYPVKRFLQRKDDIVVTGPGTLHWVRSYGVAIQTSWNIFPKNYEQFVAAFYRHKINHQIKFHKSDTIPLKSLILKYLNHQRSIMPQNNLELCSNQLRQWLVFEQNILTNLEINSGIKKRSYFYLKDLESFCCLCKSQILIYFLPAPAQMQQGISCLQCYCKNTKDNQTVDELYYKHQVYWMEMLLDICSNEKLNKSNVSQIIQLCKGDHRGCLPVQCKKIRCFEQQLILKNALVCDDKEQITNAQREIFYNNSHLYQLYQKYFSNLKQIRTQLQARNSSRSRDKLKPITVKSSKMMSQLEQGQMEQQIKTQKIFVNTQCQTTQSKIKEQQREQGQISKSKSRSRSRSKQKKKKKEKHKKKKDKKQQPPAEESPRFKTQSQQQHKIRQSPAKFSPPSRDNYQNNNRYQNQNNYGDNQGGDNYSQGNRNWGNRNNNFDRNDRGNNRENNWNNRDNNNWNDRGNDRGNDTGNNWNDRGNDRGYDRGNNWNNNRNNNWNDNRNDNRNDRGNNNWNNRDRNDRYDRNNDDMNNDNNRYDRGKGRDWNNNNNDNNNDNNQGQNDRRRNYNDYNNNNFNRDRNFQDRGRGRGRGGRGRGRGGYNRDNNDGGYNQSNDNQNNQEISNKPAQEAPQEY